MNYKVKDFEDLINNILENSGFNDQIKFSLLLNQNAKKWYDKNYSKDIEFIEENTIYGIIINDVVSFDFKVGKIENLLKSFLNKYISKKEILVIKDGKYVYEKNKDKIREKIIEANKDRIYKGLFYTTLYGIGFWNIFATKKDNISIIKLQDYLKENNKEYKMELSDAHWALRFKFKSTIEESNKLLENFVLD